MSTKPKMTPWFVNGERPARKGVYMVDIGDEGRPDHAYAYFDSAIWSTYLWFLNCDGTPALAFRDRHSRGCGHQSMPWSGLAEKPA